MADKSIDQLVAADVILATDLFVLQQSGMAKKLTGQILLNWLTAAADGHGGIQSIAKLSTSGLTDTYRITLADQTTFDFVVTNGRSVNSITKVSSSGLVDTYRISYNDNTTDTFTVTNGAKGDKGDNAYMWIKYASQEPTASSHSFGDVPDTWIGVYFGNLSSAPSDWQQYSWYQWKGDKGDKGDPATLTTAIITYQVGDSGTIIPSGTWSTTIPVVAQGKYLWTRQVLQFNTGDPITTYSVARFGIDGTGSVSSVAGISPDAAGNVALDASHVKALPIGGGDMEGPINMNGQTLSGLNAPLEETDAANKQYVDENAGDITIDMEGAGEGEANGINADTLGGQLPGYYATKEEMEQRISMKLLWTNPNHTSEFTNKTVSLDLSEYSAVLIEFHGISEAITLAKYIKKGNAAHLYVPYNAFYSRSASVNDNGVVFGDCAYPTTYNGWTMQTINSVAIPKTIYGIKGVM